MKNWKITKNWETTSDRNKIYDADRKISYMCNRWMRGKIVSCHDKSRFGIIDYPMYGWRTSLISEMIDFEQYIGMCFEI